MMDSLNFAQPSPTWRRLNCSGVHQYVDGNNVLGTVVRNGSKWLASTDHMNGTDLYDSADKSTLRDAKLWIERYAR